MNEEIAIKVENISKTFKLPHERNNSIKGAVINFYKRNKSYEEQRTLKNLSFEIKKGEFFGIVGRNGSGKSTLLKILAGIYSPTQGKYLINGKLIPFIELGVGFSPELSGRDNIFLNGSLLGFSRAEMESMYKDIVDFAELENFMDQKLKNYSSGMQVRLAFSIAIKAKGDILLLDEVLAVGDVLFMKKCYDYFKELKRNKKTVILVSHDSGALQEYCTRGILIENGKIVENNSIDKVIKSYTDIVNGTESKEEISSSSNTKRWGNGKAKIVSTEILKDNKLKFFKDKENIKIKVTFQPIEYLENPICGITITDLSGTNVFQSNTLWVKKYIKNVSDNDRVIIIWEIPNVFNTGKYIVSPAISDSTGTQVLDWLEDAIRFNVNKEQKSHSIINIEHKLSIDYE